MNLFVGPNGYGLLPQVTNSNGRDTRMSNDCKTVIYELNALLTWAISEILLYLVPLLKGSPLNWEMSHYTSTEQHGSDIAVILMRTFHDD